MDNGFWSGYQERTAPTTTVAPRSNNGPTGLAGFLFNSFVKPTVDTVSHLPGDLLHTGKAVGDMAGSVLGMEKGQQLAKSKQSALNEMQKTSFAPMFGKTVAENNATPVGQQLEKIAGKTVSDVTNVAPLGAEAKGVMGMAKLGAKIGAGAAAGKSMQQGGDLSTVASNAAAGGIEGGLAGGAFGGAGKIAGAVGSKIGAKGADILGNLKNNEEFKSFVEQFPKGTDMTGIKDVYNSMKQHGIPLTRENMAAFGNAGYHYDKVAQALVSKTFDKGGNLIDRPPIRLDYQGILDKAINNNPGLGSEAQSVRANLRNFLHNGLGITGQGDISGLFDPAKIYQTAKDLREISAGNGPQAAAFKSVRSDLINTLNEDAGVQADISKYKVKAGGQDEADILQAAGGNPTLAAEMKTNINNASRLQDLQRAQLNHIASNKIADSAQTVVDNTPPITAPPKTGGGNGVATGIEVAAAPLTHGLSLAPLVGKGVKAAAKSDAGQQAIGGAMQGAGQLLDKVTGAASKVPAAVPGLAADAMGSGSLSLPAAADSQTTPDQTSTDLSSSSPMDAGGATAGDLSTVSPDNNNSMYGSANMMSDIQRDPKNAATYMQLYKLMNPNAGKNPNKMSAVTSRQYAQVVSAQKRLSDFQQLMDQVVNQSGPAAMVSGAVRGAAGNMNMDTNAKVYNDTRDEMALNLSRALSGGSTTGSEAMMKRIQGYIPKITDSKETAQVKMQMLNQMLEDTRQSILSSTNVDTSGGDTSTNTTDMTSLMGATQ